MTPRLKDVDLLVLQIICASPNGTLYGATKLQKLLFAAHYPKNFGLSPRRPLRAFRFKVYKHGPFSEGVYLSLKRLEAHGLIAMETKDVTRGSPEPTSPEASDENLPPMRVRIYRALTGAQEELTGADAADLKLARSAVETWGWLTSEQIEELVLIRTGLTPALKTRFTGVAWEDFLKHAALEIPKDRPEPPKAYWLAQQQFFKERAALLKQRGEGEFAAYIGTTRVLIDDEEIKAYKSVVASRGRPPDFIGYISKSGRARSDAIWST